MIVFYLKGITALKAAVGLVVGTAAVSVLTMRELEKRAELRKRNLPDPNLIAFVQRMEKFKDDEVVKYGFMKDGKIVDSDVITARKLDGWLKNLAIGQAAVLPLSPVPQVG